MRRFVSRLKLSRRMLADVLTLHPLRLLRQYHPLHLLRQCHPLRLLRQYHQVHQRKDLQSLSTPGCMGR